MYRGISNITKHSRIDSRKRIRTRYLWDWVRPRRAIAALDWPAVVRKAVYSKCSSKTKQKKERKTYILKSFKYKNKARKYKYYFINHLFFVQKISLHIHVYVMVYITFVIEQSFNWKALVQCNNLVRWIIFNLHIPLFLSKVKTYI